MEIETVTGQGTCGTCGESFEVNAIAHGQTILLTAKHCPKCVEEHIRQMDIRTAKESEERRTERLRGVWEREVLPEYRKAINEALLPVPGLLPRALGWEYHDRGLTLTGSSNAGKTRIAMQVVRREIWKGRTVAVRTPGMLRREMADAATNGTGTKFLQHYCRIALLVLDDFGAGAKSEAYDEFLWEVIERRTASGLPLIVTTQFTRANLFGRFYTEERGHAVSRRIFGFSEEIDFDAAFNQTNKRKK